MGETVVTTLVVESDEKGAVDYAHAMAAAQKAAEQASAANDNYSRSMRSANDNAREAADQNDRMTFGLRQLAQSALQAAESYAKKAAAVALVVGVLGSLAAIIFPIIAIYKAFRIAIDLVSEAWDLGGKKLAEYLELLRKAEDGTVGVEFFQRLSKGAEAVKFSVENLSHALDRLKESSGEKLGGSDAAKRLDALVDAGNFAGNSGVGQLRGANSGEERIRAFASLFDQALRSGERLAALDLSRTMFGAEVTERLARDSDFLKQMLAAADKVKEDELVSAGDVARARELQDRLDAAEKILSQRWHPIQDALTQLGIRMREAWVGMVEAAASAFDWASRLVEKLAGLPAGFWSMAGRGVIGAASNLPVLGGLIGAGAVVGNALSAGGNPDEAAARGTAASADAAMADARRRLAAALNSRFDRSKDPNQKSGLEEDTAAFDRAEEALRKYVETTSAAAETIDKTTAAQERARAMAQLTAAAMKDGLSREAAEAKAKMSGLADAAAEAAEKLARARVESGIKFGLSTAFLSQDDVSIAQQLKGLYPDVATALGSVEAQGLRAANSFRQISNVLEQNLTTGLTDILTGTKSVSQGFNDMSLAVLKAIEQMIVKILIVEPLMRSLQSAAGGLGLFSIGGSSEAAAVASGVAPGMHSGGIVGSEATFHRVVSPAAFAGAPRFHTGGIAGDEVPIIARRGEGVFTPAQMAAMGRGQGGPTVNVTLVERPGAAGETTTRQNDNGGFDLEIAISQIAAKGAVTPGNPLNRALTDRMGAASRIVGR